MKENKKFYKIVFHSITEMNSQLKYLDSELMRSSNIRFGGLGYALQTENALMHYRQSLVSFLRKNRNKKKRSIIARRRDKRLTHININNLKYPSIGNHEFIALYIAKFGKCRYKEVHNALTAWRSSPNIHFTTYFSNTWFGRYWDRQQKFINTECGVSLGYYSIPNDNRQREYFLTKHGRKLVNNVLKRISKDKNV